MAKPKGSGGQILPQAHARPRRPHAARRFRAPLARAFAGGRAGHERGHARLRARAHSQRPRFPATRAFCSRTSRRCSPIPKGFHIVIDSLAERFIGEHIDAIVGVESRGFIFGSALAARLNASFVPVRKTGKLPAAVDRVSLQSRVRHAPSSRCTSTACTRAPRCWWSTICWPPAAPPPPPRSSCAGRAGYVASFAFVLELDFLGGRERLMPVPVVSLLHYAMGE